MVCDVELHDDPIQQDERQGNIENGDYVIFSPVTVIDDSPISPADTTVPNDISDDSTAYRTENAPE